jgi:hypothetical protein
VRKPVFVGLTLGVLFTLGAFRGIELWSGRTQTLASASARASNLAFILSEYLRESLAADDSALRQLAMHSRRIGGPAAAGEGLGAKSGLRARRPPPHRLDLHRRRDRNDPSLDATAHRRAVAPRRCGLPQLAADPKTG